ncbi:MAG TPA: hypothetical protein VHX19_18790 [Stellaceae bacterium]|nr:hypothetical protein [Stellaceae bacterium]
MSDTIIAARDIRVGAERLREMAATEADAELVAEMLRLAGEMDEHAAALEASIADGVVRKTSGAST